MGLPSVSLGVNLASTWRQILAENGLGVVIDEAQQRAIFATNAQSRVLEVPIRILAGTVCLRVLEATYRDQQKVVLVFFPGEGEEEWKLLSHVKEILLAADAIETARKSDNS